jgi:hypothetical protein
MPRLSFSCSKVIPLLAATLLVACGEPLTAPVPEATAPIKIAPYVPSGAIVVPELPPFSLAINPADLAGSFSFREPISGSDKEGKSSFDASLLGLLAVKVCRAAPATCTTITSAGVTGDDLKKDGDQQYKANWKPAKNSSSGMVRISVEVAGLEIGATTVGSDGRNIPIKFRVNKNAVIRTRALHAQNIDATTVAQTLVDEFSLNTTQVATRLFSDPAPFPATEVAVALQSSTSASLTETAKVYQTLGLTTTQTTLALTFRTDGTPLHNPANVVVLLGIAGYNLNEIAPSISSIFSLGDQATASVLQLAGIEAGPIGDVLHDVFSVTETGMAFIFKALGYDAPTLLSVLELTYGELDPDLKIVMLTLKVAGYGAIEIASALEDMTFIGHHELAQMMLGVGYAANEIAEVLSVVNNLGTTATAFVMKQIGLSPADISGALKTAYGATADGVTVALKGAGFAAGEVVDALRSAYDISAINAIIALTNGGYAAGQIADGLESGYSFTAAQTAVALQGAGWTAEQAAAGLQIAYNVTGEQVAIALNGAGYAADQVAGALKDVYGLSASQVTAIFNDALGYTSDAIATALGAAGYAVSEIGDAIGDFFGDLGDTICDRLPDWLC